MALDLEGLCASAGSRLPLRLDEAVAACCSRSGSPRRRRARRCGSRSAGRPRRTRSTRRSALVPPLVERVRAADPLTGPRRAPVSASRRRAPAPPPRSRAASRWPGRSEVAISARDGRPRAGQRSAGSRARQRSTIASSSNGTSGRSSDGRAQLAREDPLAHLVHVAPREGVDVREELEEDRRRGRTGRCAASGRSPRICSGAR